jgi:hypothetical protein
MDVFYDGAQHMKFKRMMLAAAAFGVFLTNAQAWSAFLKVSVYALLPGDDETPMQSFVHAVTLSCLSIPALAVLLRINTIISSMRILRPPWTYGERSAPQRRGTANRGAGDTPPTQQPTTRLQHLQPGRPRRRAEA